MTYEMKNLLLAHPSDWFINPEVVRLTRETLPEIKAFYDKDGDCEMGELPLKKIISEPLKEVYTAPIFSEKFVQILMDEIKNMEEKISFVPNDEEDELRQIPEIVLQDKCPELYLSMMGVVESIFNPIFMTIWGRHVESGGVQIANYRPEGKRKGAWHHDISSDFTIVVPLNTGEYTGGGTEFMDRGIVQPLPSGSALMFPALTHMHRGLAVESGDRYLMVFWLKCGEEQHEQN